MERMRVKKRSYSVADQQEAGRSDENQDDRRLSSRVKKPKRVYDPSDKNEPYKQINLEDLTKSPSKIKSPPPYTEPPNRKFTAIKTVLNFNGQKCTVCNEDAEGQPSVICQVCGNCFHCLCHTPRVGKTTRKATWKCFACKEKENEGSTATTGSDEVKDEVVEKVESPTVLSTPNTRRVQRGRPSMYRPPDDTKENNGGEHSRSRRSSAGISELPTDDELDQSEVNKPGPSNNASSSTALEPKPLESNENGVHDDEIIEDNATGFKFNLKKAKQLFKTSANPNPNFDTVPDCAKWNCQQVFDYFNQFFPNEAQIFKEQEIDGASLLLMTRTDMFKFNLKLGPALNIYRHVVMLQTRSYDPRQTWK